MAIKVSHYESPASELKSTFGIIHWLTFQSQKRHLLVKHEWLSNNVEMEIKSWKPQPFFNHRQCWGIDRISTLIQHRNVDHCSTLKLPGCINIELWLHDVVTNIQPYFNVVCLLGYIVIKLKYKTVSEDIE